MAPQRLPLRVYIYSLVGGLGTVRPNEFKCNLRLRGQRVGEYRSFDYAGERYVLLIGCDLGLDVFVLWDASLHPKFKNGTNVQVRDKTVYAAAASGLAYQTRSLTRGGTELVVACSSDYLARAIDDRLAWTGGIAEDEWATFPN
ncbi:hypothetical protein ACEZHJ_07625 [Arhodomonas sp. KWT2]|uniref:hypothetical protein n=1 Tax=unclassified Arhodomonas TaxID=2621637 RepID=UPI0035300CB4